MFRSDTEDRKNLDHMSVKLVLQIIHSIYFTWILDTVFISHREVTQPDNHRLSFDYINFVELSSLIHKVAKMENLNELRH